MPREDRTIRISWVRYGGRWSRTYEDGTEKVGAYRGCFLVTIPVDRIYRLPGLLNAELCHRLRSRSELDHTKLLQSSSALPWQDMLWEGNIHHYNKLLLYERGEHISSGNVTTTLWRTLLENTEEARPGRWTRSVGRACGIPEAVIRKVCLLIPRPPLPRLGQGQGQAQVLTWVGVDAHTQRKQKKSRSSTMLKMADFMPPPRVIHKHLTLQETFALPLVELGAGHGLYGSNLVYHEQEIPELAMAAPGTRAGGLVCFLYGMVTPSKLWKVNGERKLLSW